MNKIVVFASGSGSNFEAIAKAADTGKITIEITGLITNNSKAGALVRAEAYNIPSFIIHPFDFKNQTEYEASLLKLIDELSPDVVALAGYLRKIPSAIIKSYKNRILNIHPSLLPAYGGKGFYGMHVHEAVLENGESESGCSVHIVTEEYDEGPVLAFEKVPVYKKDTPQSLAKRVLEKEHELYPRIIQEHLNKLSES